MIDLERAWEIEHLPLLERRRAIRELGYADVRAYYRHLLLRLGPEAQQTLGLARWQELRRLAELGADRGLIELPMPGQLELGGVS